MRRACVLVVSTVGLLASLLAPVLSAPPAAAATIALPDLQIKVPTDAFSIGTNPSSGHRQLQFTHETWDAGPGPWTIQPSPNPITGISSFSQEIYRFTTATTFAVDHSVPLGVAGIFESPSDYRFPLTRFTLNKVSSGGGVGALVAVSPKVDYCITGDVIVANGPSTPSNSYPPPSNCTNPNSLLGLSVGWGDEYDQTDNGQPIDLSGVPDGTYILRAIVDPEHMFIESNRNNDVVDTKIQITGTSVSVLSQSTPTTYPPRVAVLSSLTGARVHSNVTLQAAATATAPASVASVRYLVDGVDFGSPVTAAPFKVTWPTGAVPGVHTITAQVTDTAGNVATSSPVSVKVSAVPGSGPSIDSFVVATGHGTLSTPGLSTTGANRLVVAFVSLDGPQHAAQYGSITGAGLTWHLAARSNAQAGDAEIWWSSAPTRLRGVHVVSSEHDAGYAQQVTVVALSGAAGLGALGVGSASSGAPHVKLTARASGSYLFAVGSDWDNAIARTFDAGQFPLSQWVDSGDGDTFWVQETSAPTAALHQVTSVGDVGPTGDRWDLAAVEVRPVLTAHLSVRIDNPGPGEVISGAAKVTSVVNGSYRLTGVRYFVDGHPLGTASLRAPFQLARWDSSHVPSGPHTLSVLVRDASGATAVDTQRIVVANPRPAMTCFVLSANLTSVGGRTAEVASVPIAFAGERLVVAVRTTRGSSALGRLSGSSVRWRLLSSVESARGALALWTAVAPRGLHTLRVISSVAAPRQALTVTAFEGTQGLGTTVVSRARSATLTTREPTSLVLALTLGASAASPAGWVRLSAPVGSIDSTVAYTNQPILRRGTTITLPRSDLGGATVAVELPGAGD